MKHRIASMAIAALFAAMTFVGCKSADAIPAGVYELPANEQFDVNAAPGHLVVIDFNAEWCGPCKGFAPTFAEAAKKYEGKVQFVSVDIDQHPSLAQDLGISSIPAILFIMPNGTKSWAIGSMTAEEFDNLIDANLAAAAK